MGDATNLTEEKFDEMLDTVLTEEEKMIKDLPSNNSAPYNSKRPGIDVKKEDFEPEVVPVQHDFGTGIRVPLYTDKDDFAVDVEDFDALKLLNEAMEKDSIEEDTVGKYFSDRFNLSADDIIKLTKLMNRHMNKEEKESDYYQDLPESIKNAILKEQGHGVFNRSMLNHIAKDLISELTIEYINNDPWNDLDTIVAQIQTVSNELNEEMAKLRGGLRFSTSNKILEELKRKHQLAVETGNEADEEKLHMLITAMTQAYELVQFAEFCKKTKVKKYDLERPDKIYRDFNSKYINHRLNIYNISACPSIINSHIENDMDAGNRICILFCKYCMNMSPDNFSEHTFMYYFIKNIITLGELFPGGKLERSKLQAYDDMNEDMEQLYNEAEEYYVDYIANMKACIDQLKK